MYSHWNTPGTVLLHYCSFLSIGEIYYYYDMAVMARPRATAYVVPKNAKGASAALEIIKKHDIYYYEVAPGTTMRLRQYGGEVIPVEGTAYYEVEEATLTDETDFSFSGGAYVFPTNQVSGTLLMYLFEPDVKDTSHFGSGFCQNKMLRVRQPHSKLLRNMIFIIMR